MSLYLHIATHRILLTGDVDSVPFEKVVGVSRFLERDDDSTGVGQAKDGQEQMRIELGCEIGVPQCRFNGPKDGSIDPLNSRVGVDDEGVIYYRFGSNNVIRYSFDTPNMVQCSRLDDPYQMQYTLWAAVAILGLRHRFTLLHTAAVVNEGRGVLCLGSSGTGKSTHARLWCRYIPGSRLLNDDSPVLYVEDGRVMVSGSAWSGKTPLYVDYHCPVAALVRIRQDKDNIIERLNMVQSYAAVQPSCPLFFNYEPRWRSMVDDFVFEVIQNVATYRLSCRPDEEAAQVCYNAIMQK